MPIRAVRDEVQARTGMKTAWRGDSSESNEALRNALLSKPFSAESAAQLALLGNPGVQVALAQTGITRAALLSAMALPNPEVSATALVGRGSGTELEVDATINVVDLLLVPVRSSAASGALEAAALEAAGAVLDVSFEARVAFYNYQAAEQALELRKTVLYAAAQSSDLAKRLAEAGNVAELDALSERALYEEARLALARTEVEEFAARERVNAALGLAGLEGARWQTGGRLAEPAPVDVEDLETKALGRNLDLQALRARYATAASHANLSRITGLVPDINVGAAAHREEGEWNIGPTVGLSVPLFYQGQGPIALADAEMETLAAQYNAVAARIRSRARTSASLVRAAAESAAFYRSTLLPLRERVLEATLRQYNAMAVGPFQVLQAKRDQVETASAYVMVLRDYWVARAEVELMIAGKVPSNGGGLSTPAMSADSGASNARH